MRALLVIVLESEYARMFECRIITSDNESLKCEIGIGYEIFMWYYRYDIV